MAKQSVKCAIFFFAVVFISSPAWAAKGLRIGFGFGPAFPDFTGNITDDFTPQPGITWDIIDLGYGITDAFSLNFKIVGAGGSVDTSGLEDTLGRPATTEFGWAFAEYAIDARYAFMTQKAFNPYLLVGIGLSAMQIEGEVKNIEVKGKYCERCYRDSYGTFTTDPSIGFDIGGGFEYYLGERKRWSVGTQIYYHFTTYKGTRVNVEHDMYDMDSGIYGGVILWPITLSYTFRR